MKILLNYQHMKFNKIGEGSVTGKMKLKLKILFLKVKKKLIRIIPGRILEFFLIQKIRKIIYFFVEYDSFYRIFSVDFEVKLNY